MTVRTVFRGGRIFDGTRLLTGHALVLEDGILVAVLPEDRVTVEAHQVDLDGDLLAPGYVDLQVNGGGGVMFNDAPTLDTLRTIAAAHLSLGATTILPTLITDTGEHTEAAIAAVGKAVSEGIPGIAGLHLEGPHLSIARKGAHDPDLIRRMTQNDLNLLCEAATALPVLMLTVAPENTSRRQVAELAEAGALVSLGHTDADFDTCMDYQVAGACCATHLFNAMSQLGSRNPGLVGAVLHSGSLSAGLIADGVHVHPATIAASFKAKTGPGAVFLVSDAMSPAGTDQTSFTLNGRKITRANGRLQLADGTLAGADLDLTTAVNVLVRDVSLDLETALAMATCRPAELAGLGEGIGRLETGEACQMIRLSGPAGDLTLKAIYPDTSHV
jgi:N-acetylglucosamine-6-phosphate deacetylase